MSIKQWNAGIIRPVPVAPAGPYQDGAAPGVWTLDQVAYWQKQGLWPTAGNSATWFDVSSLGYYVSGIANGSDGSIAFAYGDSSSYKDSYALLDSDGVAVAGAGLPYLQNESDVFVDASGNVYHCTYNGSSKTVWYAAKYNSSGAVQWAKQINLSGLGRYFTRPQVLADSSGNVYLCGSSSTTSYTGYAPTIVKLDSTGAIVWSYYYSSGGGDIYYCGSPSVDSAGNLYIASGDYNGTSLVVSKISTSGSLSSCRVLSTVWSGASGVALDADGYVYIGTETSSGGNRPAAIKLSSDLATTVFAVVVNDPSGNYLRTTCGGVALDSTDGGVYLGGFYTYNAPSRAAVAKLTSSGSLSWVRSLGVNSDTTRSSVQSPIAAHGELYRTLFNDVTTSGPPIVFQSKNTGTGTGTSGAYSYNAVTTTASALSMTNNSFSLSANSFTPYTSDFTPVSSVPTMTKVTL